nr:YfhO family protein [Carnobacterium maltaromaticum]
MNKKKFVYLILCSFSLALLAHSFFIYKFLKDGIYFGGPSDNLIQMLAFKDFLYREISNGNLFYSTKYGLGGNFFGSLSYYFSTSIVFYLTLGLVKLIDLFGLVTTVDFNFWASISLWISVARMTIVLIITTYVGKIYKLKTKYAFMAASMFALSGIYFRHAVLWEPFSDAFIWLPIILFGAEKIIQEKKPGFFVLGVFLTLFNNFYFGYINLLFAFFYIVLRWLWKFSENETSILEQIKLFFISGILGIAISLIGLFPAIYGVLNNYRPAYNGTIPKFEIVDNILTSSGIIIIPMVFLFFAFNISNYKNKIFTFFTVISLVLCILHSSPLVASIFNGFSAPQNRWEYIIAFTMGISIGKALELSFEKEKIEKKDFIFNSCAALCTLVVYFVATKIMHSNETFITTRYFSLMISLIFIGIIIVFKYNNPYLKVVYFVLLLSISIVVGINYQKNILFENFYVKAMTKELVQNEDFSGNEAIKKFINIVEKEEKFNRIDYKNYNMPNMSLIEDYNGTSLYSSLINKNITDFYIKHLKINTGGDAVNTYAGFNNRSNLLSIFNANYVVLKDEKLFNKPYGYTEIATKNGYHLLKNENDLNFINVTNSLYSEKDLKSIVDKEEAMINGVVVADAFANKKYTENSVSKLDYEIKTNEISSFDNGSLIMKNDGILRINLLPNQSKYEDLFMDFYLKSKESNSFDFYSLNGFTSEIKGKDSLYGTQVYDLLIRVKYANVLELKLPKGEYEFHINSIYGENYDSLRKRHVRDQSVDYSYSINNNKINIKYDNLNENTFMSIPIPFEEGWDLKINGVKQDIIKANYSQIGFYLGSGLQKIELKYTPPYFKVTIIISFIGLLLTFMWLRYRNKSIS